MKSAACESDESSHIALIFSTILDSLMIKESSSKEKKRFEIALKTLRFSSKMYELQVTVSYLTSTQLCSLATTCQKAGLRMMSCQNADLSQI